MASREKWSGPETDQDNSGLGPSYGLHPLHEAAYRLSDLALNRKRSKTKDLIGLLLCHGARAWRYSQPEASIHLHIGSHAGRHPVILRIR